MKEQIHKTIVDLIDAGKTEEATREMLDFLKSNRAYRRVVHIALNARMHWNQVKQKARSQQLTQEQEMVEKNKVHNTLLELAGQIESGEWNEKAFEADMRKKPNRLIPALIGGGVAGLLVAIYFLVIAPGGEEGPVSQASCPEFPGAAFNIMLLPFQDLGGGQTRPETAIKIRLDQYTQDFKLNAATKIFETYFSQPGAEFPDFQNAEKIGDQCDATLVVWGTVEKVGESFDLISQFKLTGEQSNFELTKVNLEGETQLASVPSISSIAREGILTKDIEDLVLTIFGIAAHEKGENEKAIEALTRVSPEDTSAYLLTNMILADCYLKTDNQEKAIEQYDKVLEAHPDYTLARNNSGVLKIQKGNYDGAVRDFTNIIDRNPQDAEALTARGIAYARMQKMEEAEKDFSKVRIVSPEKKLPDLKVFEKIETAPIFKIINTPSLFESTDQFIPAAQSGSVVIPSGLEKGYEIVVAGVMEDGQHSATHQITLEPTNSTYIINFKTEGLQPVGRQLTTADGKEFFPNPAGDQKVNLPAGTYTLTLRRLGVLKNLYYEYRITVFPLQVAPYTILKPETWKNVID